MSDNLSNIPKVQVVDPRIAPQDASLAIYRAPKELTKRVITASGSKNSLNNVNFTINVPQGALISRRFELRMGGARFKATVAGDAGNSANVRVFNPGKDAWQSYPINRIINSSQLTVNNAKITNNNHDALDSWTRSRDRANAELTNSGTPSFMDTIAEYKNYQENLGPLNPAGYGDNYIRGRGAFRHKPMVDASVTTDDFKKSYNPRLAGAGTDVQGQIVSDFTEPLWCPGLWTGEGDDVGFLANVQKIELTLNFVSQPEKYVFSLQNPASGMAGARSVDSFDYEELQLLVTYATPPLSIPRTLNPAMASYNAYPYYQVSNFSSSQNALVANGDEVTLQSNTYSLSGMPHMVIAYIKEKDVNKSASSPQDVNSPITGVSVTVGNKTGLLSGASAEQLHALSVQNGLSEVSLSQYLGDEFTLNYNSADGILQPFRGSGAPLFLKFADLSPSEELAPGVSGKYDFQIQVKTVPQIAFSNPELVLVFLYDGIMINQQDFMTQLYSPLFTPADVLKSTEFVTRDQVQFEKDMAGGSMMKYLSSFVRGIKPLVTKKNLGKAIKTVSAVGKLVKPEYAQAFNTAEQLAGLAGMGVLGGAMIGGKKKGPGRPKKGPGRPRGSKSKSGKGLVGDISKMSKAEIMKLLK